MLKLFARFSTSKSRDICRWWLPRNTGGNKLQSFSMLLVHCQVVKVYIWTALIKINLLTYDMLSIYFFSMKHCQCFCIKKVMIIIVAVVSFIFMLLINLKILYKFTKSMANFYSWKRHSRSTVVIHCISNADFDIFISHTKQFDKCGKIMIIYLHEI